MENERTNMKNYLKENRSNEDKSTTALCLLIVIGTSHGPYHLPADEGIFPTEDTYISIVVPSRDKFGVTKTIENMAGESHMSELLASHSFAHTENNNERALRNTAVARYREVGKSLLGDKHQLWNAQK